MYHMVGLFFTFGRNFHLVFHSGCTGQYYFQQGYFFFISLPTYPIISYFFYNIYSNGCGVVFYCGFYWHSLMFSDIENLHMWQFSIWIFSLGISSQVLCPFLNQVIMMTTAIIVIIIIELYVHLICFKF